MIAVVILRDSRYRFHPYSVTHYLKPSQDCYRHSWRPPGEKLTALVINGYQYSGRYPAG
ncbi:MAG TPA: hypothetical protein VM802_04290 [Chitinophaga sp.]|uniref:hypothetical protein n=1 Tax=Chitinophaga sp. TaxID=1869181 RepID=UPI002BD1DDF9|nr:hypothetical protein [Chitinophaga sp.]HVI44057.1 hypothetical protein [Chitinophaga sp.]